MKKLLMIFILLIITSSIVFANYTGKYGRTDNMEIGFDMGWNFFVGVMPYIFYILFALGLYWVIKKIDSF